MANHCNNCNAEIQDASNALQLTQGTLLVAAICGECTDSAKKTKLVIAREAASEPFSYDQLQNIEMFKP